MTEGIKEISVLCWNILEIFILEFSQDEKM
jgi:hypothetical protein